MGPGKQDNTSALAVTCPGARGWKRSWRVPALAALFIVAGCQRDPTEEFAVVPARPAPPWEARRASGELFRMEDQRGRVVVLSFGYTGCPDVCPTTLHQLSSFYRRLGPRAREVEVVFVSVDPERDSAALLEDYVRAFDSRFTGLRLEGDALAALLSAYQVTAVRRYASTTRYPDRSFTGPIPYTLDHTGAYLVIDRRGALRLRMPYTAPVEQLQSAVERLLEERN
ncbi:SCO family protein [Pyxidicoccus sp. 3LG]